MPRAETTSPGLGDGAAAYCTHPQHPNSKFQGRFQIAWGEKPLCTLQTFQCGFAQHMPRSRKANSPAFSKQKHHEDHVAKSRCSAPSFPPESRQYIFFSKIPSAPWININIKKSLFHFTCCIAQNAKTQERKVSLYISCISYLSA